MIRPNVVEKATQLLVEDEGFRQFPYVDTEGKLTIGYGFNLDDVGIYEKEAIEILKFRVEALEEQLFRRYEWFRYLDTIRQAVIIDMTYQLGLTGFMKFKKMIRALDKDDYKTAAKEMLDSRWARQTPNRARRLADIMLSA